MATADRTRTFMKDVKRVIIKVGTAVVTRHDGRLALGRLGALCEQVKELNALGYEVIIVTSGAVGVGKQRLKYRKLVNSSFADLQKPQMELDGKACAAVGQSGLMALYDMLFTQLDVSSSQLLVTDSDFENPNFRERLHETVESLLDLKVVPIFNENDAISTRKAPYEDSSGIFWDNDSLAGLLAIEVKADLLVLLSDVDGLYSGPPSDPQSKIIHTYIKAKHHNEITFGDKSRVGRGGMTAKVKAAFVASNSGTPVVITRALLEFSKERKLVLSFIRGASLWEPSKDVSAREMAVSARECSRRLQMLWKKNEDVIRTENEADVAAAQHAGYEKSFLVSRLTLKPGKIASLAKSIRTLAHMEDPINQILKRTEVITGAIPSNVGDKLIGLVTSRDEIADLLKLDDVIDLVIPRGSNKLVSQIKASTKIPVLGHADGICHVYIDKSADMNMAKRIVMDAKIDYPAACNAMETLLVHKDLIKAPGLDDLLLSLKTEGVTLYGGPVAHELLCIPKADSFHHEYSSMACTIEFVDGVQSAIDHIHRYGSGHTDCIVTTDDKVAETFLRQVDSAAVFYNASTRFSDGARFGLGAEVGISTGRTHARGPVGVEGLLTTRWIMRGSGQVVNGDKDIAYTHKNLPLQ
ncbi:unnamed protein product [Miscanthus lutarioriparius]|uniref:Aspartate/glutamate/uridylate kinase domain-containing protein n=1 Tax=Miscanthus lutarioriparius TaxID=422564 RepID=A0A811SJN9_9POAL|nr:unnamed protein product [Miscanthus lutarioriparius]